MPGTQAGGRKAAETNKRLYGEEFYVNIGAIGGKKSTGGGFYANPELAALAGKLGGMRKIKEPTPQQLKELNETVERLAEIKKARHGQA